ncbi:DUF4153 domain-containing protein [Nocardia altamirensis]|uniref:DUF4153 domain-containing protein n=1 Tax=Nocardia altamirensis TaxID=472158 RepID=UPI000A3FF578|nr:DUF4173 domain-containing protein [Nocardia altamirensis]
MPENTETPTAPERQPEAGIPAPPPSTTASVVGLLSAERSMGRMAPIETARYPSTPALPPMPTRVVPRWQRVSCPPGVVPAALVTAVAAAVLIPVDDPGIGWVLTAFVAIAAVYLVDRNARRVASDAAAPSDADPAVDPRSDASSSRGVDSTAAPEAAWARPAGDAEPGAAVSNPGGEHSTVLPESAGAQSKEDSKSEVAASNSRGVDSTVVPDSASAPEPVVEASSGKEVSTGDEPSADAPEGESESVAVQSSPAVDGSAVVPDAGSSKQSDAKVPVSDSDGSTAGNEGVSAATAPPVLTKDSDAKDDEEDLGGIAAILAKVGGWSRVWWTTLLILLLAVGAIRSAEWLVGLCVIASALAASLAVVGRRTVHGVFYEVIAVPLATWSGAQWAFAGLARVRKGASRTGLRVASSVAVTIALLAVFVPLLVGADATFARLLDSATPQLDGGQIVQWIVVFVIAGLGTLGALYLLAGPPSPAAESTGGVTYRRLSRLEWALPVGALTALFGLFVGVQFAAMFGGVDYVQRTAGLTYAEYARSGFWQLLTVSILSLIVILVVLHWAADDSAADRLWLRVLLSAVSVLSLVIVASAHNRMWAYQEAYGFTVQRLIVEAFALWFGLAYLLVLADLPLLRRTWLPRAMMGTVMVSLLVLAAVNPELLIADKNIDRWKRGDTLDTAYLSELSPDALPALDRLPAPLRNQARQPIIDNLEDATWQRWNLSRSTAR